MDSFVALLTSSSSQLPLDPGTTRVSSDGHMLPCGGDADVGRVYHATSSSTGPTILITWARAIAITTQEALLSPTVSPGRATHATPANGRIGRICPENMQTRAICCMIRSHGWWIAMVSVVMMSPHPRSPLSTAMPARCGLQFTVPPLLRIAVTSRGIIIPKSQMAAGVAASAQSGQGVRRTPPSCCSGGRRVVCVSAKQAGQRPRVAGCSRPGRHYGAGILGPC